MAVRNGSSQLVVWTEDLAQVLERWIKEFEGEESLFEKVKQRSSARRNENGNQREYFGRMGEGYGPRMGGVAYLSHWSGIQERRVRAILRRETQRTIIEVADQLLTAAGLTHELDTPAGSVQVCDNPLAEGRKQKVRVGDLY